jgi:hypothetical protein
MRHDERAQESLVMKQRCSVVMQTTKRKKTPLILKFELR